MFISYSWHSNEHRQWVLDLSRDLREKFRVFTLLDQYNCGGDDLITFMQKGLQRADRVLIIGTPKYKEKIGNIATYHRNEYIQNENINDTRTYLGKKIKIGRNVTSTKPEGNVAIDGANMVIRGGDVELHPGTTITNSNVVINPQ